MTVALDGIEVTGHVEQEVGCSGVVVDRHLAGGWSTRRHEHANEVGHRVAGRPIEARHGGLRQNGRPDCEETAGRRRCGGGVEYHTERSWGHTAGAAHAAEACLW